MKLLSTLALGTTLAFAGLAYAADTNTTSTKAPEGKPEMHHGGPMGDFGGDRTVTKDEFLKRHAEMFDKMDTDHDGKLTQEERKAGHEKMREHFKDWKEHHGEQATIHKGDSAPASK